MNIVALLLMIGAVVAAATQVYRVHKASHVVDLVALALTLYFIGFIVMFCWQRHVVRF